MAFQLFTCGLFDDAATNSAYVASTDRMLLNYEFHWVMQEAVVA